MFFSFKPEDKIESVLDLVIIQNGCPSLQRKYPESIGWDVVFRRIGPESFSDELASLRGSLNARDFLIACVYRGAEVGGLRDLYHWAQIGTKAGALIDSFPGRLWPDVESNFEHGISKLPQIQLNDNEK